MSNSSRSWWQRLWKTKSEDWLFEKLDPSQVPGNPQPQTIVPDQEYVDIFLKSMRVVNIRKGLAKFYGTVHSHISLAHRSDGRADFNTVVTPTELKDVDAGRIDRVITMNKRLLGPAPYRGGDLSLELGLFSIKSADLAAPYLELLESMAETASVSFINSALPFVDPLKKGFDLLTGSSDDSILEAGITTDFASLETGCYAVVAAPKAELDLSKYRLNPTDYKLEDENGNPLADYAYFIFEISKSARREDWFAIPELREKYQALTKSLREMRDAEAKENLLVMKRYLLTSPDLIYADGVAIYKKVEEEAELLLPKKTKGLEMESMRGGEIHAVEMPPLEALKVF